MVDFKHEQIDELLAFLPLFEDPGAQFVERWVESDQTESGAMTLPYPVYTESVYAFYRLAGQPHWADYDYNPAEAGQMLADDAFITRCSLDDIKTMLTYCVRGERFSDGHWAQMLETGRVTALLRRLAELADAGNE